VLDRGEINRGMEGVDASPLSPEYTHSVRDHVILREWMETEPAGPRARALPRRRFAHPADDGQ